jgi:membrane-bound lytic murein transglycosylase D
MVPPQGGPYEVRLPVGTKTLVARALTATSTQVLTAELPYEHAVKNGETVASIARRYHLRTKDLANANNLSPRERLVAGVRLVIPKRYAAGAAQIPDKAPKKPTVDEPAERVVASVPDADGFVIHKVKRGESLWSIAEDYNVTVQNLFKWNNLKRSFIKPGKPLKVKVAQKPVGHLRSKKSPRSKRT